jgi:hypothetical protein
VQHQILERCCQEFGRNVFDQSLTYGHYNLHDTSLLDKPLGSYTSFADYCKDKQMLLLAAAPLSMGLLTQKGPPDWHPASAELKAACRKAALICKELNVNISTLALLVALSDQRIKCTIVGMANVQEIESFYSIALRFKDIDWKLQSQEEILKQVLDTDEMQAWEVLRDPTNGPFVSLWKEEKYTWDGVLEVHNFWKQLKDRKNVIQWHVHQPE